VLKLLTLLPGCEIEYFCRILPISQKLLLHRGEMEWWKDGRMGEWNGGMMEE